MARPLLQRIAVADSDLCDECGLCLPLCPPAAIQLTRSGLTIHPATCTGCEKCIAPCPVGALAMVEAPPEVGPHARTPVRPHVHA